MKPITRTTHQVAAAVREHSPDGRACHLSNPELATAAGVSPRSVGYALADLEALGAVARHTYGPARTLTIVIDHPFWALLEVLDR